MQFFFFEKSFPYQEICDKHVLIDQKSVIFLKETVP